MYLILTFLDILLHKSGDFKLKERNVDNVREASSKLMSHVVPECLEWTIVQCGGFIWSQSVLTSQVCRMLSVNMCVMKFKKYRLQ